MNTEHFTELQPFREMYNIRFGARARAQEAFLFLHGFPAEQGNKNVDVAEHMCRTFDADAYVVHYAGLGKSAGSFTFEKSIEDSIAYAAFLLGERGYRRVHVVGHSWGGWVAANVYQSLGTARGALALLAPFTRMPGGADGARGLARYFLQQHPHIFPSDSVERVARDLAHVRDTLNPHTLASQLGDGAAGVLVIHAIHDDIIPREMISAFVASFSRPPVYVELDTDHRFFTNRHLLINALTDFFGAHVAK